MTRRTNASIGRFLRLYIRNVAGFHPGTTDKGSIGYTFNVAMAEDEARLRGGSRAVPFTVMFQAPGFYERQGYQVFGRIECDPPGHTRICMTKRLDARLPPSPHAG